MTDRERPSVTYRPTLIVRELSSEERAAAETPGLTRVWYAVYGELITKGTTPEAAMLRFDYVFRGDEPDTFEELEQAVIIERARRIERYGEVRR